jgi:hypothetical protein
VAYEEEKPSGSGSEAKRDRFDTGKASGTGKPGGTSAFGVRTFNHGNMI